MSKVRASHIGRRGAVSAAHPLAVVAGQQAFFQGGNAADAMIAAQAALCVVLPASCGLGGDLLALIHQPDGDVVAINGIGRSPANPTFDHAGADGSAVTVPGIVDAWARINARYGRLSLGACLSFAHELAVHGARMGKATPRAVRDHRMRLEAGGGSDWSVVASPDHAIQPQLAALLADISERGVEAFYKGQIAAGIEAAVARAGGCLSSLDLACHVTTVAAPVSVGWEGGHAYVQPPMTQGFLLGLCLDNLERRGLQKRQNLEHICVELTEASFAYRDRAEDTSALMGIDLDINLEVASLRGGPRAYLHTAGVATADNEGHVLSSLVSVFDEFGSGVYVPEGGFVLNNRARGFTSAPNDAAPAKFPVHTLAPSLLVRDAGVCALATPGADGQIQTLLQIIARMAGSAPMELAHSIAAPRWRSEDGKLLIEASHPAREDLAGRGHRVVVRDDGDMCFGGVVAAGLERGLPFAASDWRREVWHGVF